ncbi:MAG: hypothetical protein ABI361_11015 [Nitrososphaera sp.]
MLAVSPPNLSSALSTTITPSADHWYGPGLVRVVISDPLKNTAGSTITPHIEARRGSTVLASADTLIASEGSSGTFELYLTTSNALVPANPTFPNDYEVGRINSSPQLGPRDFSLALGSGNYMRDGDSVSVSYGGQSQIIQFSKSIAVASVDRTTAGDGNRIVLTISDQNANIDPTAIDRFPANASVLSVTGGTMNYTGAMFIEEGQNTAMFDLVIQVSSGTENMQNPPFGATLSGVEFPSVAQFTVHGFDVYTSVPAATPPYNAVTPNPQASSSQNVVLQNSGGVVSIVSPPQSNGQQTGNPVTLKARIIPPVIRAGVPFWINATVVNNSTQTIQYSPSCSPSFSVSFAKGLASYQGRPCNIMPVLRQLQPGQTDSVKIPGLVGQYLEANQSGSDNATVHFEYQTGGGAGSPSDVTQSLTVNILPANATLGEPFLLAYNQSVTVKDANLALHFANVTEDSRCPSDVRCIWAGRVSVLLNAKAADSDQPMAQLNLTAPAGSGASVTGALDGLTVTLQNVSPYPTSTSKPHLQDYVISLVVTADNLTSRSVEISKPFGSIEGKMPASTVTPAAGDKVHFAINATSIRTSGTGKIFAIFEVRSLETGVTEYLDYGAADPAKNEQTFAINSTGAWVPSAGGNYELRVFVVDNLQVPSSLSGVSISQLAVRN